MRNIEDQMLHIHADREYSLFDLLSCPSIERGRDPTRHPSNEASRLKSVAGGGMQRRGTAGMHPITTDPSLFKLKLNVKCGWFSPDIVLGETPNDNCELEGYGMKDPLQMYIDGQTGQFQYTQVGWLPPNAIGIHFFHTGQNPLGSAAPTSSTLSWPSTPGNSLGGEKRAFCWLGTEEKSTYQYEVFVNGRNFNSSSIDKKECLYAELAAADANPWGKKKPHWDDHHDRHDDDDDHKW
ncbi:hypothetical protein K458DRAFT_436865 [Lentithecium fluviatile CBS 122367]|uniref:Uncharacterized protein n=1 Tax=Lentithecium fluviatile CBS 122367 TaxID=1168545 RepID=A0A6G1IFS5_9PLEO|nr:hypothetical protein K458DRAFT_436865 [Lentithecium fluviatile CBS 122367]